MHTANDGETVHPMVMKAAKSLFYSVTGVSAGDDPDEWGATCHEHIADAQAALTTCGALELLEALEQAVTSMQDSGYSNSHLAVRAARAAILKVYGSAP